jgi:hypothetical protein
MKRLLKDKLLRADLFLFLLYVAYCGVVILRINIEGTGYTSPDSEYYLEAARSLRDGEGFLIKDLYSPRVDEPGYRIHFTAWPVGYPTLIYAVSWLTGLNLFWASKLVNLLFVGLGFLVLRHINREFSFILASIYSAYTIIEMYSYTWSEGPFMFGCLCLIYLSYKIISSKSLDIRNSIYLFATLCGMFLIRYITIYAFGALFIYVLYLYWKRQNKLAKPLLLVLTGAGLICFGYLLRNYQLVGHFTGIPRLHVDMESPFQVIGMTIKGIVIELFIIRKYYLRGLPNLLTIATTALQFGVIGYIVWLLHKERSLVLSAFKRNTLSHTSIAFAIVYLLVLVFLRSVSQFDPPNYRLLSPFTFLMLFAQVNYIIALPNRIDNAVKAKYTLCGFFVISLLLNLPKKFLLSHIW